MNATYRKQSSSTGLVWLKNQLVGATLFLTLVGACQRDNAIGPSDLLYRRWHLAQTRHVQDSTWLVTDMDAYYDTEYRADGTLVYRRNGVVGSEPCCAPLLFERKGVIITYKDIHTCPFVRCTAILTATITVLKTDLLELQVGDRVEQYVPADR